MQRNRAACISRSCVFCALDFASVQCSHAPSMLRSVCRSLFMWSLRLVWAVFIFFARICKHKISLLGILAVEISYLTVSAWKRYVCYCGIAYFYKYSFDICLFSWIFVRKDSFPLLTRILDIFSWRNHDKKILQLVMRRICLCILHFLGRFWIFQRILRSVQGIWGFSRCKKVWDSDLLRLLRQVRKKNNMQITNNYIWELKIQKCMLKCWIFPRNAEKIQKSEVQSR